LDSLASPDAYCDWTFATLWSWDTEGEVALSRLGERFALRMPSYPLGGPEDFSLNGKLTAAAVEDFVREHRDVSLVPRPVVDKLELADCTVVADRDQYDYVYDVAESILMVGGRYRQMRDSLRKSRRRNPMAAVGRLDLFQRRCWSRVGRV
jgi:hypothetical protein